MSHSFSVHDFLASLREGPYTSLGSYPKFWITSDGGALSFAACVENVWQIARSIRDGDANGGWHVIGCQANWEDPDLYCDHAGDRIPSAYAEPDS